MFAGIIHEEFLEVVRWGSQHDLVALDAAAVAGQSHVSKGFGLEQLLEHGEHVGLVLGPSEREDLWEWVHAGDRQLWQQTEKKNEIRKKSH